MEGGHFPSPHLLLEILDTGLERVRSLAVPPTKKAKRPASRPLDASFMVAPDVVAEMRFGGSYKPGPDGCEMNTAGYGVVIAFSWLRFP